VLKGGIKSPLDNSQFDISYVQTDTALQVLPKYLKGLWPAQDGATMAAN